MAVEINPQLSVGPVPECRLSCQNGGYCAFISTDEATLLEVFTSGGLIEHCVCPPGYSGLACENELEECHDMKCKNGAPCSLSDDGASFCDCSLADAVSHFAGDMCREPATSYCGSGDIQNRSFCTNGGLCKSNLSADSDYTTHNGCHCPPEFEGPHCEFLKGMPQDAFVELHLKQSEDAAVPTANGNWAELGTETFNSNTVPVQGSGVGGSSSPFAAAGVFVGIAISVFGLAFLAQHQRRARWVRRNHSDLLDRAAYRDETPIRVRVFGELEEGTGNNEYADEDDMHSVAISECSLEEIELEEDNSSVASSYREYLQSIRNGGYETYFENAPDFSHILGSLVNPSDSR